MKVRRSRLVVGGVLAAVVVVVAAVVWVLVSSSGPPNVEFASVAGKVSTGPAQYCDLKVTECQNRPDAVVKMAVPAGQPLQVTVPSSVSSTPWQVVFSYLAANGNRVDGRSPVFAPDKETSYTLSLPEAADQLATAQVQQYGGGQPTVDANGEPAFPIRGSWVLTTK
ncbi:DUF2771 family protein [Pseudonocardia spinosispora]|uniref:DUF2771 family protein n=1 Tax=Pseudonocardia spinosispora TaxID=103441 RepID=UPI00068404D7|nr:DUF2771 family protein [Pseudonocardia spinosispora]